MEENKQPVAQLFDINEHLRYQNNDPAHRETIYFDLDDAFSERLMELFPAAYNQAIDELGIIERGPALVHIREHIAKALGPVTLDQLLYVVHFIAGQMAYDTGYREGHEHGVFEARTQLNPQAFMNMGPIGQA